MHVLWLYTTTILIFLWSFLSFRCMSLHSAQNNHLLINIAVFTQCLEDMKIKIKRFAGSSMGASVAALLSVGYTADELVSLYIQDLSIFIRGMRCIL